MMRLALLLVRHRKGNAVATLVALACGAMIMMTGGIFVESGLRYRAAPQRYAGADLVITRDTITITSPDDSVTEPLPEGGSVDLSLLGEIAAVPGVARAVADYSVPVLPVEPAPRSAALPTVGHGWGGAALAPYRIVTGTEPRSDGEIAVDTHVAASTRLTDAATGTAGLAPGNRLKLLVKGEIREYRVSGIVEPAGGSGATSAADRARTWEQAVFFTDAEVARLSSRPGRADAIGVIAAPGARRRLISAIRPLVAKDGATVYTGNDRGLVERPEVAEARELAIAGGGTFGGWAVMLCVAVVAGTVGLSVRHRRRDIALLRAVAATPVQVCQIVVAEVGLVSLAAAALGLPAGIFAATWVRDQLVERGFVPDTFAIRIGPVPALCAAGTIMLAAVLAGLIAARRTAAIRPTEALGEVAVEPRRGDLVRSLIGLVVLAGGVALTVLATAVRGEAALGAAIGLLFTFVLAVSLLAPLINRIAAMILRLPLRAVWGASGYLAAANLRANARGMATVLTSLVMAVGLGGSLWFLQTNLEHQTVAQSRSGVVADHVLMGGAGMSGSAAAEARNVPGVLAATGVRRTTVVVEHYDFPEALSAQAVDPEGLPQTMDLGVRSGDIANLRGAAVAVAELTASSLGWGVGEDVRLWLGDGTPVRLRVVATYDRGLGFGDITLPRDVVVGHTGRDLDDYVLIRTDARADSALVQLGSLASRYPETVVTGTETLSGQLERDLAINTWVNQSMVCALVGYAAIAAVNTLLMAALARRRELSLLRLVGVTNAQIKRMVRAEQAGLLGVALAIGGVIAGLTLSSIVYAMTGQRVPYIPDLGWVSVIGGTITLALVATELPVRRLLRTAPVEGIGIRE